jgi:CubicO group peptidase (beta-lactamase class C family)
MQSPIRTLGRRATSLLAPLLAAPLLLLTPERAAAQAWHQHPYWNQSSSIQISGRPVSQLAWVEPIMRNFMLERSIPGGVFGISRNEEIVYLRGFGHDYNKQPLPENTPFRLASVSKTITVAAVRHLISTGAIELDDFVFDRGQTKQVGQFFIQVGGILPNSLYSPYPNLASADPDVSKITVSHLIHHRSGWYVNSLSSNLDYAFHDADCANDMGIASPPGPINKVRWLQGKQDLAFEPGTDAAYSNINYLLLGEIIKHVSGLTLDQYVRTHVLQPDMWVPSTEIFGAKSFREWGDPREPYYKTLNASPWTATGPWMVPNVFDSYGPSQVEAPYGGAHYEAMVPFGAWVASGAAMLTLANHYDVRYSTNPTSTFGMPLDGPLTSSGGHNGSLDGFETIIYQQADGIHGRLRFFVAFNARTSSSSFYSGHWPTQFLELVRPTLVGSTQTYPTTTSDGFWTQPGAEVAQGVGGYNTSFRGFQRALDKTTPGSKLRLLPGSQSWSGVINEPMILDAPLGTATIGL